MNCLRASENGLNLNLKSKTRELLYMKEWELVIFFREREAVQKLGLVSLETIVSSVEVYTSCITTKQHHNQSFFLLVYSWVKQLQQHAALHSQLCVCVCLEAALRLYCTECQDAKVNAHVCVRSSSFPVHMCLVHVPD